jgi:hypothetical protein
MSISLSASADEVRPWSFNRDTMKRSIRICRLGIDAEARYRWLDDGDIRPVRFVLGTLRDPRAQERNLRLREGLVSALRRHTCRQIRVSHPAESTRCCPDPRARWADAVGLALLARRYAALRHIQAQIRLAALVVRSVTLQAVVRKNWANVPVEVNHGPAATKRRAARSARGQ